MQDLNIRIVVQNPKTKQNLNKKIKQRKTKKKPPPLRWGRAILNLCVFSELVLEYWLKIYPCHATQNAHDALNLSHGIILIIALLLANLLQTLYMRYR